MAPATAAIVDAASKGDEDLLRKLIVADPASVDVAANGQVCHCWRACQCQTAVLCDLRYTFCWDILSHGADTA